MNVAIQRFSSGRRSASSQRINRAPANGPEFSDIFETLGRHPAQRSNGHSCIGSEQSKPNRAEGQRGGVGAGWKHRGQEHQFGPDAAGLNELTVVVSRRG